MRKSLIKSVNDSPIKGWDRYDRGSIILCNACAKPIFKLDAGIALGDKCGRMADRFRPLTLADLATLADRPDIDAGVRGIVASWDLDARRAHISQLREMRSGDPMLCPVCHDCFVQVLAVEQDEVMDKAYTIELLTIPPEGTKASPVRGKTITADGDWVH